MKYLLLLSFVLFGCSFYEPSNPMPKVGECFERNTIGKDKNVIFREVVKVIAVHPEEKYDQIEYVYNLLSEKNFKKGKWYTLKPLTIESKYWFFKEWDRSSRESTKLIPCPW